MGKQNRRDQTVRRKRAPATASPSTLAQYRRALKQRQAELAVINTIEQALASKLDIQAIYDLVGDKVREIFDAQVVVITAFDLTANLIHTNYLFENGKRFFPAPYKPSGFAAQLIQSRRSKLVRTRQEFFDLGARTTPGTAPVKSGIFVPLLVRGELRGGLSLQNIDRENAFDESDVRLLETFASSMSVALENARLFDEAKTRNREITEALEQQTATSEVLSALSGSATDLRLLLEIIAVNAARVCGADDAHIYRIEGETLKEWTHRGPIPGLEVGESLPLNRGSVIGRAILDRQTIHIRDAAMDLDEADYPVSAALQRRWGYHTALSIPLLRDGEPIGGIAIRRLEVKPFTEKEISQLKTFADQAVIAIENARLFNETNRLLAETQQRAAELAIINSVQQGLASQLEMQAIYDLVGDKIHEIFFDAQVVDILTYDRTTDLLYPRYVIERGKRFEVKPWSLVGFRKYVVATRQPLVINRDLDRLAVEFGNPRIIVGEMSQSAVYVPMIVGDEVTAIISLQHIDRENAFSESDVRLLETLANSMSVALENVQLRDKERVYLKGLERELEIGRQIQFSFLPDELPQPPGWEIAARFLPAGQVSGDLYDVFALQGDGAIGLVIADVCDKGVGAALYMALFRSLIRATSNLDYFAGQTSLATGQPAQFSHNVSLKNAVMLTNNYIARTHEQANMFATVFFGVLDPATGVLSYINGGHEPPIIFGAGGVKTTLVRTGMAVGLMPDIPFGIAETHLEPGDTLLAFTDGVVDAQNLADESFGREKLISLLTSPDLSATALIDRIEASLREHIANTNQFDDITMLAVRRLDS